MRLTVASNAALDYVWRSLTAEFHHVSATVPYNLARANPDDFEIRTIDDEIHVDQLCGQLLVSVRDLLVGQGFSPLDAGELCRGADYFLRDFVIAECHDNLFRLPAERVRQFAGHWYIVRTLEPNVDELVVLLAGVTACYRIFAGHGLVPPELAEAIDKTCADIPFYRQRIEDFWAIEGGGFDGWRRDCPLPPPRS